MNQLLRTPPIGLIFLMSLVAAACAGPAGNATPNEVGQAETAVSTATQPAATPPPTHTPAPTETAVPIATNAADPTAVPSTTTATPAEATAVPDPIIPIGSTASWTETNDILGIEGEIEFTSATQLVIRNFVFLAAEAPGVDIRLGVGDDFSDGIGVSLRDITGKTYEGRSLTLTLPAEAFNGRSFNSIGVFCFDTGDLFDYALIATP